MERQIRNFRLKEGEDHIRLGQLLKVCSLVENGGEAKHVIAEGKVSVNGTEDTARGRKIRAGDTVLFQNTEIRVEA